VLRSITQGINFAYGLAVDLSGNLYVANRMGHSNVAVYAPGTSTPALTITQGVEKPSQLQFDPAGELNVLNVTDVTVYAPESGTLLRKIANKLGRCLAMTFDSAGDLFVLNISRKTGEIDIVEYAAGTTKVLRSFTGSQFAEADHLLVGPDGYLYVGGTEPSVLVIDPHSGSVIRTITNGVTDVINLAFDSVGNLYIANNAGVHNNGVISVYAPEASMPSYEINQNDLLGNALLFDQNNNLYVVSPGGVFEFAPGATMPKRTFDRSTAYPWAAAFGP
jgi:DNA-binding beta-propeller fold protein YncE